MFTRSRRRVALVASVLVLVLALAGVTAYLLLPPRQSGEVAVPADDATPEQVVGAYLDAVDADDCDTAEAVTTSAARDSARSWCGDVDRLADVDVSAHLTERAQDSGQPATAQVASVPVTFDVDWRPLHGDTSMEEGPTTWGYLLVRDSPGSAWRIFDQGTG